MSGERKNWKRRKRRRNGGMRGKGSDEEMNEEGWQMVTFNNRDGEVAMSWIMRNQNKGCFQKDVLLEACALAGDTQANTCTNTHTSMQTHVYRYVSRVGLWLKKKEGVSISTLHTQNGVPNSTDKHSSTNTDTCSQKTKPQSPNYITKHKNIQCDYDIHDTRHKMKK